MQLLKVLNEQLLRLFLNFYQFDQNVSLSLKNTIFNIVFIITEQSIACLSCLVLNVPVSELLNVWFWGLHFKYVLRLGKPQKMCIVGKIW